MVAYIHRITLSTMDTFFSYNLLKGVYNPLILLVAIFDLSIMAAFSRESSLVSALR